ncbi:17443_t:CDS:2, partial [Gigaspora margarita]
AILKVLFKLHSDYYWKLPWMNSSSLYQDSCEYKKEYLDVKYGAVFKIKKLLQPGIASIVSKIKLQPEFFLLMNMSAFGVNFDMPLDIYILFVFVVLDCKHVH